MSAAPIQWLHLTDEDLSRARRVIAAFKEDDTVDVLGFQPISERFDDWFYPAVTTPMTRAKYYIAVPAIYAYLERQQLGYQRFRERASAMQHQLQRILSATDPHGRGIIGREKGEDIKRLPSAIYWSAFAKLGIRRPSKRHRDSYEDEYQRDASALDDVDAIDTDDGRDVDSARSALWDPDAPSDGVIHERGGLLRRIALKLSAAESRYLAGRFSEMSGGPESLLGMRLKHKLAGPYGHAWDVGPSSVIPTQLKTKLRHARSFSAAARALSLIYAALVVKEQRERGLPGLSLDESARVLREEFLWWWRTGRRFVERGWDVGAFQRLDPVPVCRSDDREDFETLIRVLRAAREPLACWRHSKLRELVRRREQRKRPGKCRLCGSRAHLKYLRQFEAPTISERRTFQLSFRHHRGDTIVRDLLRAPYRKPADVQD
jgi:hypothetical protein